jgi:hypothetical protein
VSFHVEVSRSFHRARAFNLGELELRARVLEPWSRGAPVNLGEREWDPAESRLTVLEGPELDDPDLALGQGWSNATRIARDVTAELLERTRAEAAAVALLAQTPAARAAIEPPLAELGVRAVEWRVGVDAAAVLIVLEEAELTARQVFEIGRAVGAFGAEAILVQLGAGRLPEELAGLDSIRIEPGRRSSQALGERLRRAGL